MFFALAFSAEGDEDGVEEEFPVCEDADLRTQHLRVSIDELLMDANVLAERHQPKGAGKRFRDFKFRLETLLWRLRWHRISTYPELDIRRQRRTPFRKYDFDLTSRALERISKELCELAGE